MSQIFTFSRGLVCTAYGVSGLVILANLMIHEIKFEKREIDKLIDVIFFLSFSVELGKQLANVIVKDLSSAESISSHDVSTNGLINYIKAHRK